MRCNALVRILKRSGVCFVGLSALYGVYVLFLEFSGNFHTVVAGEVYRSAQPSEADLARYVAQYGIRSIINLRGEKSDRSWYQHEMAASTMLHLRHYDYRLSAEQELSPLQIQELVTLMRDAPKPLLIHCRQGMDRTGLASALYIAGIQHGTHWAAENQLSPFYGHLPIPLTQGYAMTQSFEHNETMLGYPPD